MSEQDRLRVQPAADENVPAVPTPDATPQFIEPTVTFVEPKLTTHGDVGAITAQQGFFGTFTLDA